MKKSLYTTKKFYNKKQVVKAIIATNKKYKRAC